MRAGDLVRLVAIPQVLPAAGGEPPLDTTAVFRRCLGNVFEIVAIDEHGHAELEVGRVEGLAPCAISIWVEPEFLCLVETS